MYEAEDTRYCYPGTSVLKNRADLRDQIELDKFEAVQFALRAQQKLPAGRYSLSHFRKYHRHLFGGVYAWAGRYREVRIAKGGSQFCYPEHIDSEMRKLFGWLTDEHYLRDLETEPFVEKLAHFLSYLNAIHPFREGNGRTQNLFIDGLAEFAGHPVDFVRIEPAPLVDAMISAFHGDEEPLQRILMDALREVHRA